MTKKKTTPQTKSSVPSPKYANGQLVFLIEYGRSKAGEVVQAKVLSVISSKIPMLSDTTGKVDGSTMRFEYDLYTPHGHYYDVEEASLYPTLTAVSLAFTNRFVHLLK